MGRVSVQRSHARQHHLSRKAEASFISFPMLLVNISIGTVSTVFCILYWFYDVCCCNYSSGTLCRKRRTEPCTTNRIGNQLVFKKRTFHLLLNVSILFMARVVSHCQLFNSSRPFLVEQLKKGPDLFVHGFLFGELNANNNRHTGWNSETQTNSQRIKRKLVHNIIC